MWFQLDRSDLSFVVDAPWRFDVVAAVRASPEEAFDAFAEPAQMERFIVGYRRCAWHEPPGLGARRQLELVGLSFRERIVAFEPGARFAFAIDEMTAPLASKMLEDIQFDPMADGRTRVVWSVCYAPRAALTLVHPLARMGFERGYRRTLERLAGHLASTSGSGSSHRTARRASARLEVQ